MALKDRLRCLKWQRNPAFSQKGISDVSKRHPATVLQDIQQFFMYILRPPIVKLARPVPRWLRENPFSVGKKFSFGPRPQLIGAVCASKRNFFFGKTRICPLNRSTYLKFQ